MIKLHMIAAVALKTNAIGLNGELPWKNSDDLRVFKKITDNSVLIVGKRTAEKLPELPNRTLFIWDGKQDPEDFLSNLIQEGITVAWLCGGAHTYASFAHLVNGNRIINYIDYDGEYDSVFPMESYNIK